MRPSLVSSARVAERLGISENTVRWWRHVGFGPAWVKVGRLAKYEDAELEAWIVAQTSTSPGPDRPLPDPRRRRREDEAAAA